MRPTQQFVSKRNSRGSRLCAVFVPALHQCWPGQAWNPNLPTATLAKCSYNSSKASITNGLQPLRGLLTLAQMLTNSSKRLYLGRVTHWRCVWFAQAAMPVIAGRKSKLESFAGANVTYTIEAMMGDKKALQVWRLSSLLALPVVLRRKPLLIHMFDCISYVRLCLPWDST